MQQKANLAKKKKKQSGRKAGREEGRKKDNVFGEIAPLSMHFVKHQGECKGKCLDVQLSIGRELQKFHIGLVVTEVSETNCSWKYLYLSTNYKKNTCIAILGWTPTCQTT